MTLLSVTVWATPLMVTLYSTPSTLGVMVISTGLPTTAEATLIS